MVGTMEGAIVGSAAELLAAASTRAPMTSVDAKSSASFERVIIDGERYVVKHVDPRADWIARWTGDYGPRVATLWRARMLDALPGNLDHAVVAVAQDTATRVTTLLMRDVADDLVPPGDSPLPLEQHRRFLDHMAGLHAHFWGFSDMLALTPMSVRYTFLTPSMSRMEAELGQPAGVPKMIPACWAALDEAAPRPAAVARWLAADPWPLVAALAETPSTFIHGDWKAGNLGSGPDGRTLLLDWDLAGVAPPCVDLAWYLAVNCDRIPQPKEEAIATYRAGLERRHVDTAAWWDRQLELALLGAFVQLGWSKTEDPAELDWWADRALRAARTLLLIEPKVDRPTETSDLCFRVDLVTNGTV